MALTVVQGDRISSIAALLVIILVSMQLLACQGDRESPPAATASAVMPPTPAAATPTPTQSIMPTVEATADIPTSHSTFSSFAVACGKLMTEMGDMWSDDYSEWLNDLEAEIPPPGLKDYWKARKAYFTLLPELIPDSTPPELTAAYDLSMQRVEAVASEVRETLLAEGCLERSEWDAYERKSMARERLNAIRGMPLESIEEFAQACRDIITSAPEPAGLDHRRYTLEHVINEWSQLVPGNGLEDLYGALVFFYNSELGKAGYGSEIDESLVSPEIEIDDSDAEILAFLDKEGCNVLTP